VTLDPAVITLIKSTTRAAAYGASTLVVGAAIFDALVLRRSIGLDPAAQTAARARARRIGYVAACVLCLSYIARLHIQVVDSFLVAVPTLDMLRQLIFSTRRWGLGVLAQLVVSGTVLGLLISGRRVHTPAAPVVVVAAVLAAVTIPLTGHAIGHEGTLAVAVQATHVFAVGGWLGTLSVLWLTCRQLASPTDLTSIIRAFSPVALSSAALLAIAGAASYFIHVGVPSQLFSTRYGAVLLLKIAVFLSAAAFGYVNWRHVTPRLHESGQRARFTRAAALEMALAGVAILLTTVLTNLPQPGD
jgi:putative copper resistance protein D